MKRKMDNTNYCKFEIAERSGNSTIAYNLSIISRVFYSLEQNGLIYDLDGIIYKREIKDKQYKKFYKYFQQNKLLEVLKKDFLVDYFYHIAVINNLKAKGLCTEIFIRDIYIYYVQVSPQAYIK